MRRLLFVLVLLGCGESRVPRDAAGLDAGEIDASIPIPTGTIIITVE